MGLHCASGVAPPAARAVLSWFAVGVASPCRWRPFLGSAGLSLCLLLRRRVGWWRRPPRGGFVVGSGNGCANLKGHVGALRSTPCCHQVALRMPEAALANGLGKRPWQAALANGLWPLPVALANDLCLRPFVAMPPAAALFVLLVPGSGSGCINTRVPLHDELVGGF